MLSSLDDTVPVMPSFISPRAVLVTILFVVCWSSWLHGANRLREIRYRKQGLQGRSGLLPPDLPLSIVPSLIPSQLAENHRIFLLDSIMSTHPDQDEASSAPTPTQLPIANVSRLMKQSLPPTMKLSSDTKLLMQSCTQEFIALVTSEAQERADAQKRSTLNGDDVLYALGVLGFDEYEKLGRVWLSRYRLVSISWRVAAGAELEIEK